MAEESAAIFDATLLESTLPLVPGLVDRLKKGIDVADVACGSGHAINIMAEAFPNSRFVGFDFSVEGIDAGIAEAKEKGLGNARFEVKDVATLSGPPAFDLITTFDAVHDQAQPARVLQGIHDALRPGGTYLCVDVKASSHVHENMDHPLGTFLYTVSCMHCMTVSLALDGKGLGAAWGEQVALQMLRDAGFTDIDVATVEGDILNNYYVATKA
jgi:SAM-dependent methyltransferase